MEQPATRSKSTASTIAIVALVAFAIGFTSGLIGSRWINPTVTVPTITIERDTIVRTDTVRGKVPPPVIREVIRRDTLRLPSKPDTTYKKTGSDSTGSPQAYVLPSGDISIPIERKVYQTSLYRAVVSGWRPVLDSMEVYAKTTEVRTTETKYIKEPRRNWSITTGPSATYTVQGKFIPGASVTLGFVIKSWN